MSFKRINLSDNMIKSLESQNYLIPSNVQTNVIPKILKGMNLIVQSETGSGKTHSFLIPIIDKIDFSLSKIQAIIVSPTKELARQIYEFCLPFYDEFPMLRTKLITSGIQMSKSLESVLTNPQILIVTPGRLYELMKDNTSIDFSNVKQLVLDEADMLLSEGYFEEIDHIITNLKKPQILVFSATLENNLKYELNKYIGSNAEIILQNVLTSHLVTHHLIDIKHTPLLTAVDNYIEAVHPYMLLIFASKKELVNEIYSHLIKNNEKVDLLTGDLTTRERKNVIKRARLHQTYILVCSDVASRGLDLDDVSDVLNVDLPHNLTYYFHRAGRTGRFDKKGDCYTFYNSDTVSKPMELIKEGVKFNYYTLKDNALIESKNISFKRPKPKRKDDELTKEIKKAKAFSSPKNNKVKPGYKKKQKQIIEKVKKRHKRKVIQEDIKRQRIERYMKENVNNG